MIKYYLFFIGILVFMLASCGDSASKKAKQKRIDDSLKQLRIKDSLKKIEDEHIKNINTPSNFQSTIEKKLKNGYYFLRLLQKIPELEKKVNDEQAQYTLFIPSDSALTVFMQSKKIDSTDTKQVKKMLENHIVEAYLPLIDLMSSNQVVSISQKKLSIEVKNKKIYLHNARVLNSDILYNSGILHSIDNVLF